MIAGNENSRRGSARGANVRAGAEFLAAADFRTPIVVRYSSECASFTSYLNRLINHSLVKIEKMDKMIRSQRPLVSFFPIVSTIPFASARRHLI
jgi:hypothetical protein